MQLHAVCAECGEVVTVQYLPRADRPVYCSDCLSSRRTAALERWQEGRSQYIETEYAKDEGDSALKGCAVMFSILVGLLGGMLVTGIGIAYGRWGEFDITGSGTPESDWGAAAPVIAVGSVMLLIGVIGFVVLLRIPTRDNALERNIATATFLEWFNL